MPLNLHNLLTLLRRKITSLFAAIHRSLQPHSSRQLDNTEPVEDTVSDSGPAVEQKQLSPIAPDPAHSSENAAEQPCDYTQQVNELCETLRRQGRFLPAWEQMGIRPFLSQLCACAATRENQDDQPLSPLQWFQQFIQSFPPFVQLNELAADAGSPEFGPCTSMPTHSARIDNRSIVMHRRALQLMAAQPALSYPQALRHAAE